MPITRTIEISVGDPRGTFFGSFDAATARVLAAHAAFDDICREELYRAADDAAGILVEDWQAISPVYTGEYRDSIKKDVQVLGPDDVLFEVWNDAPHAGFVERGTRRGGTGFIRPREAVNENGRRRWLRFPDGPEASRQAGPWIFARRTRGMRAQHTLKHAHASAKPLMTRQFHLAATRAKRAVKAIL